MMKRLTRAALTATVAGAALLSPAARAAVGSADGVLGYFDSGAGRFAGPRGSLAGIGGLFPVAVPASVVLGFDVAGTESFLSLPTGSSVTVGFLDESVIDGVGNDIFIQEIGASGEQVNVFVSADNVTFVWRLGQRFNAPAPWAPHSAAAGKHRACASPAAGAGTGGTRR